MITICSGRRQMWGQQSLKNCVSRRGWRMRRVLGLGLLVWAVSAFGQTTFHGNVARTGVYESAGPPQHKKVQWGLKRGAGVVGGPACTRRGGFISRPHAPLFALRQGNV